MATSHSIRNGRFRDLAGQRFGRLVARKPTDGRTHGAVVWLCDCDCGKPFHANSNALLTGNTRSCGCLLKDTQARIKHGASMVGHHWPEYKIWCRMKQTCYNPKCPGWKWYGAKGIKVCDRWLGPNGFQNFIADMGRRPDDKTSIDRINSNDDYCPENCRWADPLEQGGNTSRCRFLELDGVRLTMRQWALRIGLDYDALRYRLKAGWTVLEALTLPTLRNTPTNKNKLAARAAVHRAVVRGDLPPATTCICVRCGKPAHEYHHRNGYERSAWLDVEPRCRPCQSKP